MNEITMQLNAEICDRHGITWYAAYGTLLGAVRHEGFVPWDDDMDIWVKRKDYNRLIQILPRELPSGYLVRCSLLGEKYDQFHTCVNSGSGVSIDREWLEQYHGCPFTVGLDIFPLDYLPREEKDRAMQEGLFSVASHCALLAGAIQSDEGEGKEERKCTTKEEILEGVHYLEENCGAKINRQLIEDEDWEQAIPELWKWANYFAMMYDEEESDYLVQYMDYIRWPLKKFRKEYFSEVIGAAGKRAWAVYLQGDHEQDGRRDLCGVVPHHKEFEAFLFFRTADQLERIILGTIAENLDVVMDAGIDEVYSGHLFAKQKRFPACNGRPVFAYD